MTISRLAEVTGVSAATVDRVLNHRPGVHARTRERVWAAARGLDYPSLDDGRPELAKGFDVLLSSADNPFMRRLSTAIMARAFALGVNVRVAHLDLSPTAYAEALEGLSSSQGVAVVAPDHPVLRDALRTLKSAGVPLFTLVTDLPGLAKSGYVGGDNRAAGRLAGQLMARFLPSRAGPVAIFVGSAAYSGHSERAAGFQAALAEKAPHLRLLPARETMDRDDGCLEALDAVLAQDDLAGLYNTGSGSEALADAIARRGLCDKLVFIGHELTEGTRRGLLSGALDAVIDQDAETEAMLVVEALVAARDGRTPNLRPSLPPVLILSENLPG